MAFHDTRKNNGYHSLFIKLFGHVSGHGVHTYTYIYEIYNVLHSRAWLESRAVEVAFKKSRFFFRFLKNLKNLKIPNLMFLLVFNHIITY